MTTDPTVTGKQVQTGAVPRTMRVAQMTAFRRPIEVIELPVAVPRAAANA